MTMPSALPRPAQVATLEYPPTLGTVDQEERPVRDSASARSRYRALLEPIAGSVRRIQRMTAEASARHNAL